MAVKAWLFLQLLALPLVPGAPSNLPDADTAAQIVLSSHTNQQPLQTKQRRKVQGRFLHITDFHPDELYKPHTSTEEGIACHRKKGHAGAYGAEKTDCDSPLSLVDATFDWIRENVKDDIDFIIWTGDSARHDSDEKNPRDSEEVVRTNTIIADKFIDAITNSQNGKLDVPVIPTFGNNDFLPHNIFYPGPNKWLHKYSEVWHRFIPEAQRHSFEFGGWFYVEVIPNRLAVFSLNTMYFFDRNAGVDGCASPSEPGFRHMEWLRIQLQQMRERGMKAILTGHVPPARTEGKRLWDETCWQRYTLWVRRYRDVVAGAVYGHMNIDHFLLQDAEEVDIGMLQLGEVKENERKRSEIEVRSKGDYLQELRDVWSNLPSAAVRAMDTTDEEEDLDEEQDVDEVSAMGKKKKKHKKKKYKKIGGKYAERYQLALVSPSVVPNYFPTLRVVEYNISGLENTNTWIDPFSVKAQLEDNIIEADVDEALEVELEDEEDWEEVEVTNGKKKKKKGKKGKKGKKKPEDPNLIIPDDPPKSSLPGPAYLMQPFTFTGYTQYFANLTHINNDFEEAGLDELGWRDGEHDKKKPGAKPKPRKFRYEVEYSTFDDGVYKLKDLTVKSFVKLAYRIGKRGVGKRELQEAEDFEGEEEDVFGDDDEDFEEEEEEEEEGLEDEGDGIENDKDVDATGKKGKKGKKKKKKQNKVWLHFLDNAFVKTVSRKERKKM